MRFKNVLFLVTVSLLLLANPVFAQEGAGGSGVVGSITAVGAVIAMAIASGLCGLGQGKAAAAAVEAVARNPGAAATIQTLMIIGLALIESLALFTFAIIFIKA